MEFLSNSFQKDFIDSKGKWQCLQCEFINFYCFLQYIYFYLLKKKLKCLFFLPIFQETVDPLSGQFPTGCTLGVELRKVQRRFSGNLLLPPLSWRQAEKERDRGRPLTPEEDPVTPNRPTSLPIVSLPRIDITQADSGR